MSLQAELAGALQLDQSNVSRHVAHLIERLEIDSMAVVDVQRSAHLVLMREWTVRRREAPTTEATISADYVLFHLDADLRWLDATERRLDQLEVEVAR